ncbi:MAG: hypothetical protein WKF43_09830 [Acidimicrobiales bacterium]
MDRPIRFEQHRWVGDKRTQIVHDIDHCSDEDRIAELMSARTYLCFGPDTLTEATNRGYRACSLCSGAREARAEAAEASDA